MFEHTCVELDVAVSAPLVFKQTAAERALEWQFVAVDLLVSLQVAQAAENGQNGMLFQQSSPISEHVYSSTDWDTSPGRLSPGNKFFIAAHTAETRLSTYFASSLPDIKSEKTFSVTGQK